MIVVLTVLSLVLGIAYGYLDVENTFISMISQNTQVILYVLMFSVGISIGMHDGIMKKLKDFHYSGGDYTGFAFRGTALRGNIQNFRRPCNGYCKWIGMVQFCWCDNQQISGSGIGEYRVSEQPYEGTLLVFYYSIFSGSPWILYLYCTRWRDQ